MVQDSAILRCCPFGIMFHHFHGKKHPSVQGSISGNEFELVLDFLERDYCILSAYEWETKAVRGTLKDHEICLTFDDLLRCQYDIAYPVLKKRGITAFWFVYSSPLKGLFERLEVYRYFRTTHYSVIDDFYGAFFCEVMNCFDQNRISEKIKLFSPESYLENYHFYSDNDKLFRFIRDDVLNEEQYNQIMEKLMRSNNFSYDAVSNYLWIDRKSLKRLDNEEHVLGLHTHTHPMNIAKLDRNSQFNEYYQNFCCIKEITGKNPETMSHPCNCYNADTIDVLRELNLKIGFRADMYIKSNRNEFEWPREDHINILSEMKNRGLL